MSTRDLVEARAHLRRRLVVALVRGAAEGDLPRPGGRLAGSALLAVVLLGLPILATLLGR